MFCVIEQNSKPTGYQNWKSISVSSSGQYQTALSDYIFISSDYGNTWTEVTSAGSNVSNSVSISSSGQYQTAVVSNDYIYISSDYGNNWTPVTSAGTKNWNAVSISSSGLYQVAVVLSYYIYINSLILLNQVLLYC